MDLAWEELGGGVGGEAEEAVGDSACLSSESRVGGEGSSAVDLVGDGGDAGDASEPDPFGEGKGTKSFVSDGAVVSTDGLTLEVLTLEVVTVGVAIFFAEVSGVVDSDKGSSLSSDFGGAVNDAIFQFPPRFFFSFHAHPP